MGLFLLVGLLFVLMLIRVPIAFSLGLACLGYLVFAADLPLEILAQRAVGGADSFVLLAIPLFLLAGNLMNEGGMTTRMVDFALALVGRYRGGLAQVNIGANALMSGVSGAAVADASALGSIMIPAMRKAGYDRHFSGALNASAAVIGPIIPPSIPMIVYAAAANVSVGAMFLSGVLPGFLLIGALSITTYVVALRRKWPAVKGLGFRNVLHTGGGAILALIMPAIIVGGIISGAFTPTESAAIAAAYAFIIGKWVFRELRWAALPKVLVDTAVDSTVILIIVALASAYGWMLTVEQAPARLLQLLNPVLDTPWALLAMITAVLLVLGMFMESLAVIVLVTPLLLPVVTAAGIDPVHFGALMVLNLMIGTITPPVGVVMFITMKISDSSVADFVRANRGYYVALFAVLVLVVYMPFLTTWLPSVLI